MKHVVPRKGTTNRKHVIGLAHDSHVLTTVYKVLRKLRYVSKQVIRNNP